jgi:hypothetical protein
MDVTDLQDLQPNEGGRKAAERDLQYSDGRRALSIEERRERDAECSAEQPRSYPPLGSGARQRFGEEESKV